jgi:hypothetical protein
MDSYLKAGVVSQHHYAVTHKVENASSVQEADLAVWAEVDRIKNEVACGLVSLLQLNSVHHACHICYRHGVRAVSHSQPCHCNVF